MDLPKEVQAINMLYKVYWDQKKFLSFEDFYKEYLNKYKALNYQVKKATFSREVRQEKKSRNQINGEFIDIKYEVPSDDYFKNPKKKDGEYKLPYLRFIENKELKRFSNGFVVFTPFPFEQKKKEIDGALK